MHRADTHTHTNMQTYQATRNATHTTLPLNSIQTPTWAPCHSPSEMTNKRTLIFANKQCICSLCVRQHVVTFSASHTLLTTISILHIQNCSTRARAHTLFWKMTKMTSQNASIFREFDSHFDFEIMIVEFRCWIVFAIRLSFVTCSFFASIFTRQSHKKVYMEKHLQKDANALNAACHFIVYTWHFGVVAC